MCPRRRSGRAGRKAQDPAIHLRRAKVQLYTAAEQDRDRRGGRRDPSALLGASHHVWPRDRSLPIFHAMLLQRRRNGRRIDGAKDKNYTITNDGHLILVAARLSDTGNYTCIAENIANLRPSNTAQLTVYGKTLFYLHNSTAEISFLLQFYF